MSIYALEETQYTDLLELLCIHKEEQLQLLEMQERELNLYKEYVNNKEYEV